MARGSRQTYAGRRAASRAADAALKIAVNSVLPAITGTKTVGQTLTCSTGTWSNTPDTYAYQWLRSGVPIIGATASTRVLAAADAGALMSCTVTATNSGVPAVATSAATTAIAGSVPVNTVLPAITGTAQVGETLTTDDGTWTGTPTPTYAYQWLADDVEIDGATASTYVLTGAEEDALITVTVTATNLMGATDATSEATAAVIPA